MYVRSTGFSGALYTEQRIKRLDEKLDLSADQKARLRVLLTEFHAQQKKAGEEGRTRTRKNRQEEMKALNREIEKLLTEEQTEILKKTRRKGDRRVERTE